MQKSERWMGASGNPSARLRAARSMPHWMETRGGLPTPPPPPPEPEPPLNDPDYEVIDVPDQSYCNTMPTTVEVRVRRCELCGASGPSVLCEQCPQQSFCPSCDEMYHRHPKRQSHIRRAIMDNSRSSEAPRPPLPPKGDSGNSAPVPPPRRNKKNPLPPQGNSSTLKRETGIVGSIKRIITGSKTGTPPPRPPSLSRDRSASLMNNNMDFTRGQIMTGMEENPWARGGRVGSMTALNMAPGFGPMMHAQSMAHLGCPSCWGWGSQAALHQTGVHGPHGPHGPHPMHPGMMPPPQPFWYPSWDPRRHRRHHHGRPPADSSSEEDEHLSPALSRRSMRGGMDSDSDDSFKKSRPQSRRESLADLRRRDDETMSLRGGRYDDDVRSLRGHRRDSLRRREETLDRDGRRLKRFDDTVLERGVARRSDDTFSERGGIRRRQDDLLGDDRRFRKREDDLFSERGGRRPSESKYRDDDSWERSSRKSDKSDRVPKSENTWDRPVEKKKSTVDSDSDKNRSESMLKAMNGKKQDRLLEPIKTRDDRKTRLSPTKSSETLSSLISSTSGEDKVKASKKDKVFSDTGQRRRATLESNHVQTVPKEELVEVKVVDENKESDEDDMRPLGPIPNTEWECQHCTYVNPPGIRVCEVCCKTRTVESESSTQDDETVLEGTQTEIQNIPELKAELEPPTLKAEEPKLREEPKKKEPLVEATNGTQTVKNVSLSSKGTSPPPQSISTQTYDVGGLGLKKPSTDIGWTSPKRSFSRQSVVSDAQSGISPPRSRSPGETDSQATDSRQPRRTDLSSIPNRVSIKKGSKAGSLANEQSNTMVQKQVNQGLEMVRLLREAEVLGFSSEEVSVAVEHCGDATPIQWLIENWTHMIDTVVTLATNYGHERKENTIGTVSEREARAALVMHQGSVWSAVTEVVQQRQNKYGELLSRGNFSREDIVTALTAHHGDLEAAYTELTKDEPEDPKEEDPSGRVQSWLTQHVYQSLPKLKQTLTKQQTQVNRRHSDVHRFLDEVLSAQASPTVYADNRYGSLHNLAVKNMRGASGGDFGAPPERYMSLLNLHEASTRMEMNPRLYPKQPRPFYPASVIGDTRRVLERRISVPDHLQEFKEKYLFERQMSAAEDVRESLPFNRQISVPEDLKNKFIFDRQISAPEEFKDKFIFDRQVSAPEEYKDKFFFGMQSPMQDAFGAFARTGPSSSQTVPWKNVDVSTDLSSVVRSDSQTDGRSDYHEDSKSEDVVKDGDEYEEETKEARDQVYSGRLQLLIQKNHRKKRRSKRAVKTYQSKFNIKSDMKREQKTNKDETTLNATQSPPANKEENSIIKDIPTMNRQKKDSTDEYESIESSEDEPKRNRVLNENSTILRKPSVKNERIIVIEREASDNEEKTNPIPLKTALNGNKVAELSSDKESVSKSHSDEILEADFKEPEGSFSNSIPFIDDEEDFSDASEEVVEKPPAASSDKKAGPMRGEGRSNNLDRNLSEGVKLGASTSSSSEPLSMNRQNSKNIKKEEISEDEQEKVASVKVLPTDQTALNKEEGKTNLDESSDESFIQEFAAPKVHIKAPLHAIELEEASEEEEYEYVEVEQTVNGNVVVVHETTEENQANLVQIETVQVHSNGQVKGLVNGKNNVRDTDSSKVEHPQQQLTSISQEGKSKDLTIKENSKNVGVTNGTNSTDNRKDKKNLQIKGVVNKHEKTPEAAADKEVKKQKIEAKPQVNGKILQNGHPNHDTIDPDKSIHKQTDHTAPVTNDIKVIVENASFEDENQTEIFVDVEEIPEGTLPEEGQAHEVIEKGVTDGRDGKVYQQGDEGSSEDNSRLTAFASGNLKTKIKVEPNRLSPVVDIDESSDKDVSPIPTDSEGDKSRGPGINKEEVDKKMVDNRREEMLLLLKESLSKDVVLDRLVGTILGVLQGNGNTNLLKEQDVALLLSEETKGVKEIPVGVGDEGMVSAIQLVQDINLNPKEALEETILQHNAVNRTSELIKDDIQIKKDEFQREARKVLAEGLVTNYQQAELVVNLIELKFSPEEAVQAANECTSLATAISFLQQECPLCANKCTIKEMIGMLECDHRCCKECAFNYFNLQVTEASVMDCVCPYCRLPNLKHSSQDQAQLYFSHLDILLKGILPEATHELFQRKLRDWTLAQDPNFKWCTKCSSGFIANPNQKVLMCPDCRSVTCARCRKPWEGDHEASCEEVAEQAEPEKLLNKHLEEEGITCPACRARYSLARGGCMHMTCSTCKHEFCSGCSKPFLMGDRCQVSQYCAKLGLHAHHPRNCLFYLRDKEPQILEQLLKEHNVDFKREEEQDANSGRCKVNLLKETDDGMIEAECSHPVHAQALCRSHYVEHLVRLVKVRKLDPATVMDLTEAQQELRRRGKQLPDRLPRQCDQSYLLSLIKIVQEEIPLE